MSTVTRFDDATMGQFMRELELRESDIDRESLAELPFAEGLIVPLDIVEAGWAKTVSYRRITKAGAFKLVGNYYTSVPMINVLTQEFIQRVRTWAGGYWISDDDIEAFEHTGEFSLEQEDISGVVEVGQQTLNELIAFGDRRIGMPGFVNYPDCLYSYSPLRLDASSTPRQCLAILSDAAVSVVNLTAQVEKPDTMLLPLSSWNYLTSTPWSDNAGDSILKQYLNNSPYIKNIQPLNELTGAGPGGENVIIVYRRDKLKVKAKITQSLKWKQLERKGMGFERPAAMKYAGLQVRRPFSMHIVVGV